MYTSTENMENVHVHVEIILLPMAYMLNTASYLLSPTHEYSTELYKEKSIAILYKHSLFYSMGFYRFGYKESYVEKKYRDFEESVWRIFAHFL